MKASEVIKEMQKLIDKYGDLPVVSSESDLVSIIAIDKEGYEPAEPGDAVEILFQTEY